MSGVIFSSFSKGRKNGFLLIYPLKTVLETSNHVQKKTYDLHSFSPKISSKSKKYSKKYLKLEDLHFFFDRTVLIYIIM